MDDFPRPAAEAERLSALRQYEILDTMPEQDFDDLARLAALICETPIALVNLLDSERGWFKARVGTDATEIPRDDAFCSHAIAAPDRPLVVDDLERDERFAANPLVQTGEARFYAGAPVVTADGHAIGTICVIDSVPRSLAPEQIEALAALSRQVVAQLELRAHVAELKAARDEAEAANRSKTEFLARMGHELRTPLNAIIGFSQLTLTDERLDPGLRDDVTTIAEGGRHLLELVNEILDIARIEAGAVEVRRERVGLLALLERVADQVRPAAATRELELVVSAEQEEEILTDPERLRQLLHQLASNAVDHNRTGGKVSLLAERVDGEIAIAVVDTGPGIAPEDLPRLFAPFDRLGAERSRDRAPGAGLGLPLARRVAELLGGHIEVESTPGAGSRFTVHLPLSGDTHTRPPRVGESAT